MAKCKRVLRCHRCGKILQSDNPKLVGYTNPQILEEGENNSSMIIYCDECHDILVAMNNSKLLLGIRSSLILMIPVLLIGSISVMLNSFPIDGYQDFIHSFCDGIIANFFSLIHTATFGVLSLYVCISISISVM